MAVVRYGYFGCRLLNQVGEPLASRCAPVRQRRSRATQQDRRNRRLPVTRRRAHGVRTAQHWIQPALAHKTFRKSAPARPWLRADRQELFGGYNAMLAPGHPAKLSQPPDALVTIHRHESTWDSTNNTTVDRETLGVRSQKAMGGPCKVDHKR